MMEANETYIPPEMYDTLDDYTEVILYLIKLTAATETLLDYITTEITKDRPQLYFARNIVKNMLEEGC
jgi:hypothetical protein